MPATPSARTMPHRARLLAALLAALIVTCAGAVVAAPGAHAASRGTGFGTWAPISTYGWHGSMLVDGVHTYCILPGAPAPTGQSVDQGVTGTAAGLSAQQLTGINLLVTKYGQTNDPVQAAAVGWAVKAVVNLDETLHHFGYQGDSLAEAIHWTFSALAPEHSAQVQRLAVMYYDEARAAPAGVAGASGSMVFTTDAAEPRHGSVRVDASTAAATGTLSLAGATFVATGTSTLTDAVPGVEYPILADPPDAGRPFTVSGTGHLRLTAVAAVRHFTTAGGQDTAGPAGEVGFDVAGSDAAPRVPVFSPTITTQVQSAYANGGPFVDDVVFGGSIEDWPRAADGAYLPVTASAEVYRTDEPADAERCRRPRGRGARRIVGAHDRPCIRADGAVSGDVRVGAHGPGLLHGRVEHPCGSTARGRRVGPASRVCLDRAVRRADADHPVGRGVIARRSDRDDRETPSVTRSSWPARFRPTA